MFCAYRQPDLWQPDPATVPAARPPTLEEALAIAERIADLAGERLRAAREAYRQALVMRGKAFFAHHTYPLSAACEQALADVIHESSTEFRLIELRQRFDAADAEARRCHTAVYDRQRTREGDDHHHVD